MGCLVGEVVGRSVSDTMVPCEVCTEPEERAEH